MSMQHISKRINRMVILTVTLLCTLLLTLSSPTQAQTGTVDFVGHIGGTTKAVFVEGNYAYIGEGPRLIILDISNPATPIVVGKTTALSNIVEDVFVSGSYAYVTNGVSGLQIFDISNPFAPNLISSYDTPSEAHDVYVVNNNAYVADGVSLQIINISNPSAPSLTGSITTWTASGVYVVNNYAYVADGLNGLQIVDISNPSSPSLEGSVGTPNPDIFQGIVVVGNYAYIADAGNGFHTIDISNPSNPILVNEYYIRYTKDVYVVGNYAYVTSSDDGLHILNISNPASPSLVGGYDTPGTGNAVYVSGNYTYIANGHSGLDIINITSPSSLSLVSSYHTLGSTKDVYVTDNYAYIAGYTNGLDIINISNPSTPSLVSNYDTPSSARDVHVAGNYAYVADYESGLQIINISNTASPSLAGSYDTSGDAEGVYVAGNYAYVADAHGGLQILDISNPATPSLTGNYNTPGYAYGIYVVDNYAYIADGGTGLQIINISNPTSPSLTGSYNTPDFAFDVYVADGYAYVADDSTGLQVVNVSNPAAPTIAGSYDTPSKAEDIYGSGNFIYIADRSSLQIIDVSNPTAPSLSNSISSPSSTYGVYVVNDYIYLANYDNGLDIYQYQLPDLMLHTLSLSPAANVCQGDTVTVYVTEENVGTEEAGSHQLNYYLDSTSSGYNYSIGSDTISTLAAGNTSTQNQDFTVNTAGTWYVKALADSNETISESDEANNGAWILLTVNTDTTPPTGTVSIENGNSYVVSTGVNLAITASDPGPGCTTTVDQMRFSNNDVTWSNWESYTTTKSWSLNSGEGMKTVYVQLKDSEGNISTTITDTITLDSTPPSSNVISPADTVGSQFTVTWSGDDSTSGVAHYDIQYQQDGGSWLDWQTDLVTTEAIFNEAQDGATYCFRSRAEDNAGNVESYPATADQCVTVDVVKPDLHISTLSLNERNLCLGDSVTIAATEHNQGQAEAGTHTLTYYEDTTAYGQTNEIGSDAISSLAISTSSTQYHTFTPSITGTRYLTVLADATNVVTEGDELNNSHTISLTVTSDLTAPTGMVTIENEAETVNQIDVTLTLTATDTGPCATGVADMRLSNDSLTWSSWENYSTSRSWNLNSGDSAKTVYVQYRDEAGLVSPSYSATILLDTTAPTSEIVGPNGSSTPNFTVQWAGNDAGSGLASYDIQLQQDGGAWLDWQTGLTATQISYTGATDGATYCFRSRATDHAGNVEPYPTTADQCATIDLVKPDLHISTISLSDSTICVGDGVTLNVTEANQGNASAPGHLLQYFADTGPTGYTNQIGETSIITLTSGESAADSHRFTPAASGTYYLKTLADATELVTESDELNNGASLPLVVHTDTTAPTGTITINQGLETTTSPTITLALTAFDAAPCATGVTTMRLSANGTTWQAWQSYTEQQAWYLSPDMGEKTVYVQFRDALQQVSPTYTDTIVLTATTATPTPTPIITVTPTVTATPSITMTPTATPTLTATPTVTPTPLITVTRTPTPTATPTPTPTPTTVPHTPAKLSLVGPPNGFIETEYVFRAAISPTTLAGPLTYLWSPPPQVGQGQAVATYTWPLPNQYTVSLTVGHAQGNLTSNHPIRITLPPDVATGDNYENDDLCGAASTIAVDGRPQHHTFHQKADVDWVKFDVQAGQTYIVEARTPPKSSADVALELHNACGEVAQDKQENTFSTDVNLSFKATTTGPYYLYLQNDNPNQYGAEVRYHLSVRTPNQQANGALVLVAGRKKANDPVQPNIYGVTQAVYNYSQQSGCTDNDIYYLAPDSSLPGVDAPINQANLKYAITEWAKDHVGPDKRFTLYLMDHGKPDKFYLSSLADYLTPNMLDDWLTELETEVPEVEINVIFEACYSGSFLDATGISKPGRLIMASTAADKLAYASDNGALFSDALIDSLHQGANLYRAYEEGSWLATESYPEQQPWLEGNGNAIPNEPADQDLATQRGFACAGPPPAQPDWAPQIKNVYVQSYEDGTNGIWAEVADDEAVQQVWAMVYPPHYDPPTDSDELVVVNRPPLSMRTFQTPGLYGATYQAGFDEPGEYRLVIYARDNNGLLSRPKEIFFSPTSEEPPPIPSLYLPLLMK